MKMISGSFWSALASLRIHSFHSRTVTSAQLQDSSTLPHRSAWTFPIRFHEGMLRTTWPGTPPGSPPPTPPSPHTPPGTPPPTPPTAPRTFAPMTPPELLVGLVAPCTPEGAWNEAGEFEACLKKDCSVSVVQFSSLVWPSQILTDTVTSAFVWQW